MAVSPNMSETIWAKRNEFGKWFPLKHEGRATQYKHVKEDAFRTRERGPSSLQLTSQKFAEGSINGLYFDGMLLKEVKCGSFQLSFSSNTKPSKAFTALKNSLRKTRNNTCGMPRRSVKMRMPSVLNLPWHSAALIPKWLRGWT